MRCIAITTPSGASSSWRGGSYWQKNQSAGAIALLGYGQRVQWNNVMDTGVMLNWDKRPYDGKRESNLRHV
jgi:biofilm PGA synthesis protein PgaA